MKQVKLSRPATIALILGGDLLLLVMGWVLLVGPQRSAAASMAKATQAAEAQIIEAQSAAHATAPKAPTQPEIRTAGLYELAKAMPATADMPDLLLELDQVARAAGVTVGSITPGPASIVLNEPYSMVAIQLTFSGNFYSLTDLLYRLNSLVAVQDGTLDATGRLFAVDSIGLSPSGVGNSLNAVITVDAYIYGVPAGTSSATAGPPTTPSSTDTTSTGTSTTTTSSASSDVAPRP